MKAEPVFATNNYQSKDAISLSSGAKDFILRIWPYLSKHKILLFILLMVSISYATISRILPNIIGHSVDQYIVPGKLEGLPSIIWIYGSLGILRFVLAVIRTYYFRVLGQKTIYDLRSDLYTHVQYLPVEFFDKNPVGRLVTRITNDFDSLAELLSSTLADVFVNILGAVAIIIAMTSISLKLTVVVLIISPLVIWTGIKVSNAARDVQNLISAQLAKINSFIAENIAGIKIIQLYTNELRQIRAFDQISSEYRNIRILNQRLYNWLIVLTFGFSELIVILAMYYGGWLNIQSSLTVGTLIAFLAHAQDLISPIKNILQKYQTFQSSFASGARIFTLFDVDRESFESQGFHDSKIEGSIEFKNVTFSYDENSNPVLKNVSFQILPGQSIAIVGNTGSGKSTIVALIQRFYDLNPECHAQGKILFDGIDIRHLNRQQYRSRVGVVRQDPFIFYGTLESNISFNDPDISSDKVLQAATAANCKEMLRNHPGGLKATVQEGGANLSAGEKQLISFARILAFNPNVLILDEATANIDSVSESLIQNAIREVTSGRTSIIIAHRLSTILRCDRIFVMNKGELVEQGTHSELLALGGIYQNLYNLQFVRHTSKENS